jgi:hypothetical protein
MDAKMHAPWLATMGFCLGHYRTACPTTSLPASKKQAHMESISSQRTGASGVPTCLSPALVVTPPGPTPQLADRELSGEAMHSTQLGTEG